MSRLEHANITVKDAGATAKWMAELFDWTVRWEGASIHHGYSVHVGGPDLSGDSYLALYSPAGSAMPGEDSYQTANGLNHIAVIVDDLDATERQVKALGYETHSHADYAPGRRFYFKEENGLEIEVVSYPARN